MIEGGAFHNDPALKARAIADAEAEAHAGWSITATPEEREALAQAYGLTSNFLSLIVSPRPMRQSRAAFIKEALEACEPGVDPDALVRDWMLAVWADPEIGAGTRLQGSAAWPAAEAIIALVGSKPSAAVSRQAWRQARNALISVKDLPPAAAAYATVATSMAWDPASTPTLAGDVWIAWEQAAIEEVGLSAGWPKSRENPLMEAVRACHRQVYEECGQPTEGESRAEHEARVSARLDLAMAAAGIAEEMEAFTTVGETVMAPAFMAWAPQAQATILEACRSARPIESA